MSKKNEKTAAVKPEEREAADKKYPTERLLKSRHLAGYQRDFARVILSKPAYSIAEAKAALDNVLKGGR